MGTIINYFVKIPLNIILIFCKDFILELMYSDLIRLWIGYVI